MTNEKAKIRQAQMTKSKRQLKSKCLNAKTTLFYPWDFELWNLAVGIATLRSQ
jgi:hypothetical protein